MDSLVYRNQIKPENEGAISKIQYREVHVRVRK